jgi:hypothetical protein
VPGVYIVSTKFADEHVPGMCFLLPSFCDTWVFCKHHSLASGLLTGLSWFYREPIYREN